ncbi:hypothetical protein LIMNO130_50372 [Limnobacter sp. 130]|nr:hypothetical protein LIMNO130_50372 [Limnobacter sp. 130]
MYYREMSAFYTASAVSLSPTGF